MPRKGTVPDRSDSRTRRETVGIVATLEETLEVAAKVRDDLAGYRTTPGLASALTLAADKALGELAVADAKLRRALRLTMVAGGAA